MRDYAVGLIVAALVLTGAYLFFHYVSGSSTLAQESVVLPTGNDDLLKLLNNPEAEEEERLAALLKLGDTKEDLDVIVPELSKWAAGGTNVFRQSAGIALGKIGEPGVKHLKPFFTSEFKKNDYGQVENLREVRSDRAAGCAGAQAIGDACDVYLPQIKELLNAEDKGLRQCALFAFFGMKKTAIKELDLIIKALDDPDFNNQCFACRIIRDMGPKASKAEPTLHRLLEKGLPSVRGWAAICLGSIGPSPTGADNAAKMTANLEKASPVEKSRILEGLSLLGPEANHVAKTVRTQLSNWDRDVQAHAAIALWKIDNDKKLAIETISSLIRSNGYEQDGLEMVQKMGEDGIELLSVIKSHANSDDPLTRERVALAIGFLGPKAKSATSVLQSLSKDADPIVRYYAGQAMKKIAGEN